MLKTKIHKDDIIYGDLGKIVLPSSDKTETFEIENDPRNPAFIKRKDRWLLNNRNSWNVNNHLAAVLKRVQVEEDGIFKKRIGTTCGAGNNKSNYFEELPIKRAHEPASVLYAQSLEKSRNEPKKEEYKRNGIFVHKDLNNSYYEKMSEASIDEKINIKESTNVPSSTTHELFITLLNKNKDVLHEEKINTSIKNESITHAFKIEDLTSANNLDAQAVSFVKTTINIEHEDVHLKEEETIDIIDIREVVHFRPHSKYRGEYGFDWFRNGDSDLAGEKKFSYILQDPDKLKEITKEYTLEKTIKRDHSKKYFIPKLTIYPNKAAILEMFSDKSKDILKKIQYKASTSNIKIENYGKLIKIICTNEFSSKAFIEARLNGKLIGKLEVLANNIRKELDIIMVRVKLHINTDDDPTDGEILSTDSKNISNALAQAYIKSNIETFEGLFDLVGDEGIEPYLITLSDNIKILNRKKNINDFFESKFNEKYPEYKNKLKVFFTAEPGPLNKKGMPILGRAEAIHCDSVTIFKDGNNVISHEVLHALGLLHSFQKIDPYKGIFAEAKYPTKKAKTNNIMDYGKRGTMRYYSYSWQWKKLFISKLLRKEK